MGLLEPSGNKAYKALADMQWEPPKWMFNGQTMTLEQFAQAVYGDSAEATHFILKHSK